MIRYEQLKSHEVSRLRSVRLRALRDAPDAFGTTFAEARARTEDDWEKQLAELTTFVAVEAGRAWRWCAACATRQHIREHQRELTLD
jgi:hypothetical protein